MELTSIDNLLSEIEYLRKKARLADYLLQFYDTKTMNLVVPSEWPYLQRINPERLKEIPRTPRHKLNRTLTELLPTSEWEDLVNWDRLGETADNTD